jgi:hypothetical protein
MRRRAQGVRRKEKRVISMVFYPYALCLKPYAVKSRSDREGNAARQIPSWRGDDALMVNQGPSIFLDNQAGPNRLNALHWPLFQRPWAR